MICWFDVFWQGADLNFLHAGQRSVLASMAHVQLESGSDFMMQHSVLGARAHVQAGIASDFVNNVLISEHGARIFESFQHFLDMT